MSDSTLRPEFLQPSPSTLSYATSLYRGDEELAEELRSWMEGLPAHPATAYIKAQLAYNDVEAVQRGTVFSHCMLAATPSAC